MRYSRRQHLAMAPVIIRNSDKNPDPITARKLRAMANVFRALAERAKDDGDTTVEPRTLEN